jgi:hypothetical protein
MEDGIALNGHLVRLNFIAPEHMPVKKTPEDRAVAK